MSIVVGMEERFEISADSVGVSFEVTGVVKWFDAVKGYGFIIPDDGRDDVLVHLSCLKQLGIETLEEGATVTCEVVRRPKGNQAVRVIDVDETTSVKPAGAATRPANRSAMSGVVPIGDFETAIVKWFNRARGYGFVTWRGYAGYLHSHGDAAAARHPRFAARPAGPGPFRGRPKGTDGGRGRTDTLPATDAARSHNRRLRRRAVPLGVAVQLGKSTAI